MHITENVTAEHSASSNKSS